MLRSVPPLTAAAFVGVCAAALFAAPACLRRDVAAIDPTTKIDFEVEVPQPAVTKVDLLIMVDNSSSMGDKQKILADAVPDLVRGLVRPQCVDKTTRIATGGTADPLKPEGQQCPSGQDPAFPPITDMHIGVLSSSLGGLGSESCKPGDGHTDDKGHLLARGPANAPVAAAGDLNFIAWYPDVETNRANKKQHPEPPVPKTESLEALDEAFGSLIRGVGQDGCGLEAQLESVYRFLVQPDPWTAIHVDNNVASYGPSSEVDVELLKQRAAFLRPDSLVAIIVLSDEDDSIPDPLYGQGSGWITMSEKYRMPRATKACETAPGSPECRSCLGVADCDPNKPDCAALKADPNCKINGGRYENAEGSPPEDSLNVRFHKMKQRFGVDPQFPISRYVDGLTKRTVPSRDREHEKGAYAAGHGDCTNPLFAAHLPAPGEDFCKLPYGPRTKDLVYFAIIGGIPNTLLPDGDAPIDWGRVLGRDPDGWNDARLDPHMIPSTSPRRDLPPPGSPDNADPVHGREWTTGATDLEYACTFDLYQVQPDSTVAPVQRKCGEGDLADKRLCDCDGTKDPPLCSPTNKTVQVRGKAYPARRELMVARDLGTHGIVASLCPKQLTDPKAEDYGYKPAVRKIVDRLIDSLTAACLPRPLIREGGDKGEVPCLVLATLPEPGPDSTCLKRGLQNVPPDILERHRDKVAREEGQASRQFPVCLVSQVVVPAHETCRDNAIDVAFCYVEDGPGMSCKNALVFTKAAAHLEDARFALECIQLSDSH